MPKPFKAKFFVESVQSNFSQNGEKQSETIGLRPVTVANDKGNESFSRYTPAGSMQLVVTNPELWGAMTGTFVIDFTPAD